MERWTIPHPLSGRFRLHINFGGPGFWCMFDHRTTPDQHVDGVEVSVSAAADADTRAWFLHIRRGMETGEQWLQEHHGRLLTGVRVEITKVHTHAVATTAVGCERYGKEFIYELGRYQAGPLPSDDNIGRSPTGV